MSGPHNAIHNNNNNNKIHLFCKISKKKLQRILQNENQVTTYVGLKPDLEMLNIVNNET